MIIENEGAAVLKGHVAVEEAQALHEFLIENPDAEVDLSGVGAIHTAALQVLLAARPRVRGLADETPLWRWVLRTAGAGRQET